MSLGAGETMASVAVVRFASRLRVLTVLQFEGRRFCTLLLCARLNDSKWMCLQPCTSASAFSLAYIATPARQRCEAPRLVPHATCPAGRRQIRVAVDPLLG